MNLRNIANEVLKLLDVSPGPMTPGQQPTLEVEAREARRARRRALNPQQLAIPGHEKNRAARRLAAKNGIEKVETFLLMRRVGLVEPNERRIDKKKIAAFKRFVEKRQGVKP